MAFTYAIAEDTAVGGILAQSAAYVNIGHIPLFHQRGPVRVKTGALRVPLRAYLMYLTINNEN